MKYISLQKHNRGFTALFAVMVSSIMLAIGISIVTTSLKDLLFSSTGKASQLAFYSADSGAECAIYWDKQSTTGNVYFPSISTEISQAISCNGESITPVVSNESDDSLTTSFDIGRGQVNPVLCAHVRVNKRVHPDTSVVTTKIDSRGYNTCDTASIRKTEQAVITTY